MLVPLVPSRQNRKLEISGAGGPVSPKLQLFVLLWALCCFILINKGTVKIKGSDGESKLFSVKENNQSWAGGTSGHRRRRELQKQTGFNQSLPATKMAKVNKAQSVRVPQQYAKRKRIPDRHNYVTLSLLRHNGTSW